MSEIDKKTGIWSLNIAGRRHQCDFRLVAGIAELYKDRVPETAADMGCGNGRYCAILRACGWPHVVGYEGTPGVKSLGVYDMILHEDLTKPVEHPVIPYDVVLFLEVAEHIPKNHERQMLDNVRSRVKIGGDLIMSWAPQGQYSASGHVNPRSPGYVKEFMKDFGFRYEMGKTAQLQNDAEFDWFKNNLIVFRRAE